jgi:hypothetical protein
MRERGLDAGHSTVFRRVQRYAPEINKRIRQHLKMSGTSYRVDETYVLRRKNMEVPLSRRGQRRANYRIHARAPGATFPRRKGSLRR